MATIAIVDDDIHISNMLTEVLQKENYKVIRAYSGTEALYLFNEQKPDLILLDLMLPGLSGEEVLEKVKGIPVIVISAKLDVDSKVGVLLSGAADYLTKPFDTKELLARITVQLRKNDGAVKSDVFSVGELSIDKSSHEVFYKDIQVRLTKTEYYILQLLMTNAGKVLAKSVILDRLAEEIPDCTEYSLKQHISNLRVKLRDVSGKDMIEAVWGIGYKLS